jgi:Ner family transcriptional regulator
MLLDAKTKSFLHDPIARWNWIRFQLSIKGLSISSVAREHGVRSQTLSSCRNQPYPKMEKIIAEKIGYSEKEIFPDRFNTDGTRKGVYSRKTH